MFGTKQILRKYWSYATKNHVPLWKMAILSLQDFMQLGVTSVWFYLLCSHILRSVIYPLVSYVSDANNRLTH